jgi:hypothetical protein
MLRVLGSHIAAVAMSDFSYRRSLTHRFRDNVNTYPLVAPKLPISGLYCVLEDFSILSNLLYPMPHETPQDFSYAF